MPKTAEEKFRVLETYIKQRKMVLQYEQETMYEFDVQDSFHNGLLQEINTLIGLLDACE